MQIDQGASDIGCFSFFFVKIWLFAVLVFAFTDSHNVPPDETLSCQQCGDLSLFDCDTDILAIAVWLINANF